MLPLIVVSANPDTGKIIFELPKPDADGIAAQFIYIAKVETGLGSAAVSLDRGTTLTNGIVRFRRIGSKIAVELVNSKFVASTGTLAEREGVAHSFPSSVLWVGDIAKTDKDGSFSFDFAPFLAADRFGLAGRLGTESHPYTLDGSRSVADPTQAKVFPRNAEFASLLSFTSQKPTSELRNVSPNGTDVTMWVHHSLVALPEKALTPRTDPYGFVFSQLTYDYSTPLGLPILRRIAERHRLEKTDPSAVRSPVKEPIVFYIDPAAPEPVRQALLDGVSWWAQAFDAAGLVDAFRVAVLPDDVDPLDARYNVVNWVNRATRGWSYGGVATDPRSGEVIKGAVMLGSLRVRQDIMIYQALVGAGLTNSGGPEDPVEVALRRIRQLGAHEVGHALGFEHNFAASSQGRYSVMDYPAPRVELKDGKLSLADAYGTGLGDWDRFLVAYLYGAQNDAEGSEMVRQARAKGLRFVSDNDSRGSETANPLGAIWDDFGDPVAELARMMTIRRAALARFGIDALPQGQDLSDLRRSFVPVWLIHRYQVEAAAKALGGVVSPVAVAGETVATETVPAAQQNAALAALLDTLSVDAWTVPARLQPMLSFGQGTIGDYQTDIEVMPTAGGPVFDSLGATEIGATMILGSLLEPERLNRLEMQSAQSPAIPSVHAVVSKLIALADSAAARGAVGRRIATTIALELARTARAKNLSSATVMQMGGLMGTWARQLVAASGSGEQADWQHGLGALLSDHDALSAALSVPRPEIPPGMPI
ncbi:zinc-dependent metalloprotease [Novosphingobium sp. Gsoil 351]|uniref:zinc-dependent metalloprotease n=1 Tax=Novosphingobium sp. Gsoil 351 TaxID=2675225 RepID=UPI0012B46149|nr:zinc-dependent metalloprotease [Novosphingobium sp. Gsoil 351]QGN54964.1 DUF5117 domain-containing protein [Novosphingobium sp. Gsoil 351]